MALSPLKNREERFVPVNAGPLPSRTYALNFDTGEIEERRIDGEEALRQFIRKAIATARYRFMIYDGQYGCELESLLGQDISQELLKLEITRVVKEALLYDERIQEITHFQIRRESDKLFISFHVVSGDLSLEQEVTIGNV